MSEPEAKSLSQWLILRSEGTDADGDASSHLIAIEKLRPSKWHAFMSQGAGVDHASIYTNE